LGETQNTQNGERGAARANRLLGESGTETGTKPGVGAGGSQKAGIGLKPEVKLESAF
jgi:hypothetical protein